MLGVAIAALVERAPGVANGEGAGRHPAVDLSDDHGAAAAVVNDPGLEVVGAEVDERANGPRVADDLRHRQLVQAVLGGDHGAVVGEVRQQR